MEKKVEELENGIGVWNWELERGWNGRGGGRRETPRRRYIYVCTPL
jgi:hypothetical protein